MGSKKSWKRFDPKKENVLLILHEVQECNNEGKYISDSLLREIASYVSMPLSELESVVSFYSNFNREKRGDFQISVCDSLSCRISGSLDILSTLQEKLGLYINKKSSDGMIYLETVNCLGSCDTAPNIMVNGMLYKNMDEEKIVSLINLLREEASNVR